MRVRIKVRNPAWKAAMTSLLARLLVSVRDMGQDWYEISADKSALADLVELADSEWPSATAAIVNRLYYAALCQNQESGVRPPAHYCATVASLDTEVMSDE